MHPAKPVSIAQKTTLVAGLLGLLVAALGAGVIRDFSGPLLDGNDTDQYAYTSYYFANNLTLWPLPALNLLNNQAFYPYGTHHVFLPWGLERDYFYALLNRWPKAEYAPFLQVYYLYSLVVVAVGTYLLLWRRFGHVWAVGVGLVVSVFSFYSLFKYPVHLNMAVTHWTVLCMLATFRLLHDLVHRQRVGLPFWLVWAWLHLAVLGLELGYVAGYALAFTTLTAPGIAYLFWRNHVRSAGWKFLALKNWFVVEYTHNSGAVLCLATLLIGTAWAYLPLAGQISVEALSYSFPPMAEMRAWSSPLRLFIPSLRPIDSHAIDYGTYLHDHFFESYAQTSPGLYLTLLGVWGGWQQRRRVWLWAPVAGLLLLCLAYHPVLLPTLKIFPWFAFNRHAGRATLVYPVLLSMLALGVRWPRRGAARVGLLALLVLMGCEWYSGYTYRLHDAPKPVNAGLLTYLRTLRDLPGKAILDWPFCIQGADSPLDFQGLCPHYDAQNGVNTLRRFYHKASVGQYVGRLHPRLLAPFLADQWPRLLRPGYTFTPADWGFLDRFLAENAFAGVQLYPDLLTPTQTAAWVARYGPVLAQTTHPTAGRLWFLPNRDLQSGTISSNNELPNGDRRTQRLSALTRP